MVFNGEIYNYVELRAELRALGHEFRSSGDSEVLLTAYAQWGAACVDRLRGMFAFCIVDRRTGAAFIARDRFGIKPLFLYASKKGLLFASELKVIRHSGLWTEGPNLARFAEWLAVGRTDAMPESRETFLAGVEQIHAGECLTVSPEGTVTRRLYWSADNVPDDGASRTEDFDALFDDVMKLHLRADVPVGVLLSGGMDSTAITCRFSKLTGGPEGRTFPIHAFCYAGDGYDETAQLRDTIEQTKVLPHRVTDASAAHMLDSMRDFVWYQDEPVHSASALIGYELYRLAASNGIRVVLSGHGADESLAGYPSYFDSLFVSLAMQGRFPSLLSQASLLAKQNGTPVSAVLLRCARAVRGTLLSRIPAYRHQRQVRLARRDASSPLLTRDFAALITPNPLHASDTRLGPSLRQAVFRTPLPQYLRIEDRNSMAHSIESRVPFLDHRLVEFGLRLPLEAQMWDGWNKRSLRDAMRGQIPASVVDRKVKYGFPNGIRSWFSSEMLNSLQTTILEGPVSASGWVNVTEVNRVLQEQRLGADDHSQTIFNLVQLSSWLDLNSNAWTK